jgi:2'-5' RNA ligase
LILRVFFALNARLEQNQALTLEVAPLVTELQAQAVPAQNVHATLCFIGAIESEKLDALRAAAASVRGRRTTLRFESLECWETPKILCATAPLTGAAQSANELARLLGEAAIAAGFAPDIKPFRPHLTLGRKVGAAAAAKFAGPRPLATPLVMHCDEFVLMQSQRNELGSVYSTVDSWPLYV